MAIPTQAGFLDFLRTMVGIDASMLPDDAPVLGWAFKYSTGLVTQVAQVINGDLYELMVYNLGTDFVVNTATDQDGMTTFRDLRKAYGLLSFVPGVISSAGDAGTSSALQVPDFFKRLTLADLQYLKTPWGRTYLSLAQSFSTAWGIT